MEINEVFFHIWYLIAFAEEIFLASCNHNELLVSAGNSEKTFLFYEFTRWYFFVKKPLSYFNVIPKFLFVRTEIWRNYKTGCLSQFESIIRVDEATCQYWCILMNLLTLNFVVTWYDWLIRRGMRFLLCNITTDGAYMIILSDERRNWKLLGGKHPNKIKSWSDKWSKTKNSKANGTRSVGWLRNLFLAFRFYNT